MATNNISLSTLQLHNDNSPLQSPNKTFENLD